MIRDLVLIFTGVGFALATLILSRHRLKQDKLLTRYREAEAAARAELQAALKPAPAVAPTDETEFRNELEKLTAEKQELECRFEARSAEFQRTLDELHRAEARYRAIFESSFQFTGLLSLDGTLLAANRALLDFAGMDEDEVIGRRFRELPWWGDSAATRERLGFAIHQAGAGECVRFDLEMSGGNGTITTVDFSLKPIYDEFGEVAYLLPECHDISELLAAGASLAQARKMESIGQLTGGVAHDFNNVLQGVRNCLDTIGDRLQDEQTRRLFDAAQQGLDRGARLVQHLLAFARRQTLSPRPVNLLELFKDMRSLLERTMGGPVHIEIEVPADTRLVKVDPAQLELMLLNLALNGRDAMPQGGPLILRAENSEADPPDGLDPGLYVAVSVTDRGTGMDARTLERAFEPFFTTKEIGTGSGLGLSMVHGTVAQSGGCVHIDSRLGQGTTVTLYLPCAEVVKDVEPAPPPGVLRSAKGSAVLLVDDDCLVHAYRVNAHTH
ncbi:MAG: ATP-binding protein [Rhodospirillaceae bacterium]